jgi:hypothetical protein
MVEREVNFLISYLQIGFVPVWMRVRGQNWCQFEWVFFWSSRFMPWLRELELRPYNGPCWVAYWPPHGLLPMRYAVIALVLPPTKPSSYSVEAVCSWVSKATQPKNPVKTQQGRRCPKSISSAAVKSILQHDNPILNLKMPELLSQCNGDFTPKAYESLQPASRKPSFAVNRPDMQQRKLALCWCCKFTSCDRTDYL